jgi:two-component system, NtrC family, nitrogen regulation response regulator NtrX
VRVLAATNQNLADMVRAKRFREDLYYRLNVVTMELPPLRERGDDVLLLAEHFLHQFCRNARRKPPKFSAAARKRLVGHDWPGNVRELRNTVERLLILSRGPDITAADVERLVLRAPDTAAFPGEIMSAGSFTEFKERAERAFILAKLREHEWNVSETARAIDMPRSNLYKKIERYQLVREDTE